ncbi:MAG: class I SAM-dependent methyltransferase [Defluviitaleaceae bacterium]|nr:class I SAM-dependent methyltransferase [Defluviitaleaceae bacterium]
MFEKLSALTRKPALYEKGTMELWTDEHISAGMLEAHLNPDIDGATRKHATVRKIVKWVGTVAPAEKYRNMLDLGCGPGIYAEQFHKAGYNVTGLDFSQRSVDYAKKSAHEQNLPVTYHRGDYLVMDFKEQFDLITLIYCDFGALSAEDRACLLKKIHAALKPGGLLIFDVFTPHQYAGREEYKNWEFAQSGFFAAEPYLCLNSLHKYDNTFCKQHIVITENSVRHINVWEHTFTKGELSQDLHTAGLSAKNFYGNISGADYSDTGTEMCVVAEKTGCKPVLKL